MSTKDFISGSILEFKVPLNLGYAYCKIIDFRELREADGILAKVYNYIGEKPLKAINILGDTDWLFGARRMPWLPNTRGKGAWKLKGVWISDDDNIIPDFKDAPKLSVLIADHSTIEKWYVIKNISEAAYDNPCTYDQVKHLEDTVLSSQYSIEIRTAMEILRTKNLDAKDFFDLKDIGYNNMYQEMINVPLYSTIPKDIRGRGLC